MLKDKTQIMTSSSSSLPKPKTIKKWKEKWNWPQFSEKEKLFCVLCRKREEKLKKMFGFTEKFIQGSDKFEISAVSDHDKSKMHVQAVIEGKYIASTKRGDQLHPATESLSIPKNSPVLKGFTQMQAIENAGLIKQFEVAYLTALKGRPFSDFSSLLELEKIYRVKFLEKCEIEIFAESLLITLAVISKSRCYEKNNRRNNCRTRSNLLPSLIQTTLSHTQFS